MQENYTSILALNYFSHYRISHRVLVGSVYEGVDARLPQGDGLRVVVDVVQDEVPFQSPQMKCCK